VQRGLYYQKKFWWKVHRYGEQVKLLTRQDEEKCPGAFNPYTNEYDPARDRAYHRNNPTAPICEKGYITEGPLEVDGYAFVGFSLTEEMVKLLGLDEFRQGDIMLYFPYDTSLDEIESVRYPVNGNDVYGIYRKDSWRWDNTVIYHYALARLIGSSS